MPSRENHLPSDTVMRSNFPIILSIYNVCHNDNIYSLLTCSFAMYRRSSTLILSSLVCDGVKHVLRYIFTNWSSLQWFLDTPFWGKLMYITFICSVTVVVSATTGTIANRVPSIPCWAYAGKKLFLYNIKFMWMFTDLTMIPISLWSFDNTHVAQPIKFPHFALVYSVFQIVKYKKIIVWKPLIQDWDCLSASIKSENSTLS